jgi:hypothetical protein
MAGTPEPRDRRSSDSNAPAPPVADLESTEPEFEPNPVMHLLAPVIAIVATMAVRKALAIGYEQVTGHKPPAPRDPAVRFTRAVAWAVVTAATAAAVETMVYRAVNKSGSSAD